MLDALLETDIDKVLSLSEKDYYSNLSFVMQLGLVKDVSLYTDMIDNLYELAERDRATLEDMLERAAKARTIVINNLKQNSISPLSFGYIVGEALSTVIDGMTPGEYLSLGCVTEGFISYQKNWLTKEEYYELRDMFVPFNMPISVELLDIDRTVEELKHALKANAEGTYSMCLLKKIGKTVIDNTITLEDFKEALEEINFDEW